MATYVEPGAYARYRPVVVADSLADLRGATSGVVELPIYLDWGPSRSYDLSNRDRMLRMYAIVLCAAVTHEDLASYIEGGVLVSLWNDLVLPDWIRLRWQERFPELAV